ncbi:MAG TPA: hypothetical protein VHL98_00930 [Microvirga sp.]|jgi:hypothetical protein|nr:hypothetical protein [Microvirga sp.]
MRIAALTFAAVAAVAMALAGAPAEAKGGKGHGKGRGAVASMKHHGPPAWAPAHGYRRKVGRSGLASRSLSRSSGVTVRYERRVDRW